MSQQRRSLAIAALGVFVVVVLACGWLTFDVRRTWSRLDSAANRVDLPTGFTEVDRIRQGTALCWVTCTNGGEAIVTVLATVDLSASAACRALRTTVASLADRAPVHRATESTQCIWGVELDNGQRASGVVIRREDMRPLGPAGQYGYRWTDAIEIPSAPVLAWITFSSGIE